jgi:hypothetical protein
MRLLHVAVICFAVALCTPFSVKNLVSVNRVHGRTGKQLNMAGELELALDMLPLLAAPSAALVAGQAALSQKKTLAAEVEYAERELNDVKKRLQNTETQITVRSRKTFSVVILFVFKISPAAIYRFRHRSDSQSCLQDLPLHKPLAVVPFPQRTFYQCKFQKCKCKDRFFRHLLSN